MRKRLGFITILLVIIGFSLVGLTRLRFETNILEVLPKDLPSVGALKVSQKYFSNDQQVVLLLESKTDEIDEKDAAELTALLREKLAPAKVLYKSELEENPGASARALAELWRYAPPEEVEKLAERLLDPAKLTARLGEVKSGIGRSFDQQQSTMAVYDPLGFLEHPAVRQFMDSEFSFQGEDGKSQIILITNPNPGNGYKEQAVWLEEIRQAANSWPGLKELDLSFRLTGGPVFNAEIGAGMEHDMSGTIVLTSLMTATLFWLVQRRWSELLLTLGMLTLIFVITLGIGGWIYGTLNLVSVGFAAVLLGLAIDYPVVIARQSVNGTTSAQALRRAITSNIVWAAITTIIVFGGLSLSSFNGVRQLGGLISIGLVTGAVVTLTFTPMFIARFPCRAPRYFLKSPFPTLKAAWIIIAVCLVGSLACFVSRGAPKVSFDFAMVEPTSSEAAATFESIKTNFSAWSEKNLQVIAEGRSWEELRTVAESAGKNLQAARESGVISHYQFPIALIPDSQAREANRETLKKIAENRKTILDTIRANGFSDSGVALDSMILESLAGPENPADLGALSQHFLTHSDDENYYLAGMIKTRDIVTNQNIGALAPLLNKQFTATGWAVLKTELLPFVQRDFYWIILPTAAALFLSLLAVFRSWKDALISSALLITIVALLNAFLVFTGQPWNFLSGIAIPLVFGSGVDYCIHLIYSLRRNDGDWTKVWNSAGKAVCFCGFSTVIGFGSLAFASNAMLRSMGIMCSMAVVLATVLSLLLVPALWKWSHR